jgi:hypothetical protein
MGSTVGQAQAPASLGVRWTIGAVSECGFEALRLSIWGAWRVFGAGADYAVCVNTIPLQEARDRTGPLPIAPLWHDANADVPPFVRAAFGPGMAEGVGWKFAPLRLWPDRRELALDNDCILWALPPSLRRWLEAAERGGPCLLAEDVRAAYGQFADQCPPAPPLNSGIRGLPPGFDLEAALRAALADRARRTGTQPVFTSELDEQGLQAAALSLAQPLHVVRLDEVAVCSPFHPHRPEPGRDGAHFVGLNARHIAWDYFGRPADAWMAEHWARLHPLLVARTGAPEAAVA